MTNKTVLGIFSERRNAGQAIDMLKDDGYNPKDISIIMKDKREGEKLADDTGTDVVGGAVTGATTGAVVGGLAGLLASFVIPGLGVFFIGGPIAAALGLTGAAAATASGAATGALAGGLLGALTGFGLSDDEAKSYEERVKGGGILVAIPARAGEEGQVRAILTECGADDITVATSREEEERYTGRDARSTASYSSQHAYAGAKGGRAKSSQKGKGRGWHGDSKGHAMAGRGEDVPGRGDK